MCEGVRACVRMQITPLNRVVLIKAGTSQIRLVSFNQLNQSSLPSMAGVTGVTANGTMNYCE